MKMLCICITSYNLLPEFSHTAKFNSKGGWEMQSFFHVIISPAKNQKSEVKEQIPRNKQIFCPRGVLSIIYDVCY